jgi:hypothetical protein
MLKIFDIIFEKIPPSFATHVPLYIQGQNPYHPRRHLAVTTKDHSPLKKVPSCGTGFCECGGGARRRDRCQIEKRHDFDGSGTIRTSSFAITLGKRRKDNLQITDRDNDSRNFGQRTDRIGFRFSTDSGDSVR